MTDLTAIREALEKATKGPWVYHQAWHDGPLHEVCDAADVPFVGVGRKGNPTNAESEQDKADALLIVAAVNALPGLLAALDAQKGGACCSCAYQLTGSDDAKTEACTRTITIHDKGQPATVVTCATLGGGCYAWAARHPAPVVGCERTIHREQDVPQEGTR